MTTNEREILWAVAQTRIDAARLDPLREIAVRDDLDWEYVFGIANRNAVLPVVARNLLRHFGGAMPESARLRALSLAHAIGSENLFLTRRLIGVLGVLEENGIGALPFKGPLLAAQAYGDLGLRQFVDLDVLVRPSDFPRAAELLIGRGFTPYGEDVGHDPFAMRRKDLGLAADDGRVRVELHWKLSGEHFALKYEPDKLWQRLEKVDFGGVSVRSLAFPDLFVYLCVHGSRHGWEKLGWAADLRELIERNPETDWNAVREHARRHGAARSFDFAIHLVGDFYGVSPAGLGPRTPDPAFPATAARIREKILERRNLPTPIGDWYGYHLMLRERAVDRIKLHAHYLLRYARLALSPNDADRARFHLPKPLEPLYYVLRPSRLMFERLKSKLR